MEVTALSKDLSKIYNNSTTGDVCFKVGKEQKKFYGHRTLLSLNSKTFFHQFFLLPNIREEIKTQRVIEIELPEVTPQVFVIFLKFFYCKQAKVNSKQVWSLLYLSQKYQVPELIKLCLDFVVSSLTNENIFGQLEKTIEYEQSYLYGKLLEFFDLRTYKILSQARCLNNLDFHQVHTLYTRISHGLTQHVPTIILFYRIYERYLYLLQLENEKMENQNESQNQNKKQNKNQNKNKKQFTDQVKLKKKIKRKLLKSLKSLVSLLQFDKLNLNELIKIQKTGILSDEEIFQNLLLKFSTSSSINTKVQQKKSILPNLNLYSLPSTTHSSSTEIQQTPMPSSISSLSSTHASPLTSTPTTASTASPSLIKDSMFNKYKIPQTSINGKAISLASQQSNLLNQKIISDQSKPKNDIDMDLDNDLNIEREENKNKDNMEEVSKENILNKQNQNLNKKIIVSGSGNYGDSNNAFKMPAIKQVIRRRKKIALLALDPCKSWREDVAKTISNVADVIIFDLTKRIPLFTELQEFNTIFHYASSFYSHPNKIGDLLGKFLLDGKGVIFCPCFCQESSNTYLTGLISKLKVLPVYNYTESLRRNSSEMGNVLIPNHIIMNGVEAFEGGNISYRIRKIKNGGRVVARWKDKTPLILVTKRREIGKVVLLNFFPVSRNVWNVLQKKDLNLDHKKLIESSSSLGTFTSSSPSLSSQQSSATLMHHTSSYPTQTSIITPSLQPTLSTTNQEDSLLLSNIQNLGSYSTKNHFHKGGELIIQNSVRYASSISKKNKLRWKKRLHQRKNHHKRLLNLNYQSNKMFQSFNKDKKFITSSKF
ncbi:pep-cterm sorting domain-containing protein [Anaeramoeba flamelloides]|uniref:Pep-cterm sorting domain-containing protein n=1 Tax=Anaeramoeba flamelloides TaxID=1746091 RepID=A0ABQ8X3M1_9EUKA|nr:pep-cterm sorting domain-containing protein [Anaeramoeba flamelloides]